MDLTTMCTVFAIFGHFVATIGARFLRSQFEHFLGTVDPQTRVPKSSQWSQLQSYKFLASLDNPYNSDNFLSAKFQKHEFSWLDSYKKFSFWNFEKSFGTSLEKDRTYIPSNFCVPTFKIGHTILIFVFYGIFTEKH